MGFLVRKLLVWLLWEGEDWQECEALRRRASVVVPGPPVPCAWRVQVRLLNAGRWGCGRCGVRSAAVAVGLPRGAVRGWGVEPASALLLWATGEMACWRSLLSWKAAAWRGGAVSGCARCRPGTLTGDRDGSVVCYGALCSRRMTDPYGMRGWDLQRGLNSYIGIATGEQKK